MAVLLLYSTTDGHTKTITNYIADKLLSHDASLSIEHQSLETFLQQPQDMKTFEMVILGASIRYGRHKKSVTTFIERYEDFLKQHLFAFFSVNLTARKPEKNTPESNPYLMKFYGNLPLKPHIDAVFAGKLAYPDYKWYDKMMIRLIMKITKGPTDPTTVKVFTDWSAVDNFVAQVHDAQR